jgi:hypothetical protein
MKPTPRKTSSKSVIIGAIVVGLLVGALVYGVKRVRELENQKREALELQQRAKEAVKEAKPLVGKTPARSVFDPAFLQTAFGDNPLLLAIVRQQLQQATAQNSGLIQTDIAMFAVTYEPGPNGRPTNTVTYLIGDLKSPRAPGFSDEGQFRRDLPPALFDISNSILAIVGREIQLLGKQEDVDEQRELLEGVLGGDPSMLKAFLYDKQQFRAVIPDPGRLLPESFGSVIRAVAVSVDGSLDGGRGEITFIAPDRERAPDLAKLVGQWRTLAIAAIRVRYGSQRFLHIADMLAQTEMETQGVAVTLRGKFDKDFMDSAFRVIRVMGHAHHRIERSPLYVRPNPNASPQSRETSQK